MEVGAGVRAQLQQMQNQIWTWGFPPFLHFASPERGFAKTLAVEKQVGLSRVLSTPCSGKRNICHGTIYSLSNWIMTFVLDEYNVLGGRERNRGRKKNPQTSRRERKKAKTSMFWTALLLPSGCKREKRPWCSGEMNVFSVCCQEANCKSCWIALWMWMPKEL